MTKLYSMLVAGLLMTVSQAAFAGDIAILDTKKLFREAKATKTIAEQIEAKRSQYQQQLSQEEKKLGEEKDKLRDQQSLLSKEAFQKEFEKFRAKLMQAQTEVKAKRLQLEKAQAESLQVVDRKIRDISAAVAKEKGVKLVLPAGAAVYSDSSLDITEEVFSRLNSELPRVDVEIKELQIK